MYRALVLKEGRVFVRRDLLDRFHRRQRKRGATRHVCAHEEESDACYRFTSVNLFSKSS